MISATINGFIICFILSGGAIRGFANQHVQTNHTTQDEGRIRGNHTDEEHLSVNGSRETERHISGEHEKEGPRQEKEIIKDEYLDKANLTAYLKNVTREATKELAAMWEDQRTYMLSMEEEKNVIFQTYRVELKKVSYLVERTRDLIEKQKKIIATLKWNEKVKAEHPQPYHDEVIDKVANAWKEIERFFRQNKLKGVDVSMRRVNKLLQKAKEELDGRWEKIKKFSAEIERLKSY